LDKSGGLPPEVNDFEPNGIAVGVEVKVDHHVCVVQGDGVVYFIGAEIQIAGRRFSVIGILKHKTLPSILEKQISISREDYSP